MEILTTSIFDSPAQTLVNPVNTVGVMGKGLALQFKQQYPEMYLRYRQYCLAGQLNVGQLYLWKSSDYRFVLNFPTKEHWRNPSRIEYIEDGMKKLVDTYIEKEISSIAFPRIGCGLGGLDWEEVEPIFLHYTDQMNIPVFLHIFR
ncbi:MAG: macro domain-containing protein [Chloroflexota bacterium]